jgi:hypothetical protein
MSGCALAYSGMEAGMKIDWGFIFRMTVIILCFLVMLAEFLQGGTPWPFLVFTVAALALVGLVWLGVLR